MVLKLAVSFNLKEEKVPCAFFLVFSSALRHSLDAF